MNVLPPGFTEPSITFLLCPGRLLLHVKVETTIETTAEALPITRDQKICEALTSTGQWT